MSQAMPVKGIRIKSAGRRKIQVCELKTDKCGQVFRPGLSGSGLLWPQSIK
jgi:hypothetical protein